MFYMFLYKIFHHLYCCITSNRIKKDLFIIYLIFIVSSIFFILVSNFYIGRIAVLQISNSFDFFYVILLWFVISFIIFAIVFYIVGFINYYNKNKNNDKFYEFRVSYFVLSLVLVFFVFFFFFIFKNSSFLYSDTTGYCSNEVFGCVLHKLTLVDANNPCYSQIVNEFRPFGGPDRGFFRFPRLPLNIYNRVDYNYYLLCDYDVLMERFRREAELLEELKLQEAFRILHNFFGIFLVVYNVVFYTVPVFRLVVELFDYDDD